MVHVQTQERAPSARPRRSIDRKPSTNTKAESEGRNMRTPSTEQEATAPAPSTESTEHQTDTRHVVEPIDIIEKRKAAALRDYGYVQSKRGLYSVREGKEGEKETLMLIERLHVDVLSKRHIYTVPDHITEQPKEHGVVLVTQLAALQHQEQPQVLEIHRSDMLSKQPRFFEQMQAVKPPHKRKQADFISAIEAMAMSAPVERRYNATGLVLAGDTFTMLQPAGGGITEHGIDEQYRVQLPISVASRLTSIPYGWKRASTPDERIGDYQALLHILDIAPGASGYGDVLLGLHGFTPMSQLCDTGGVWAIIHGQTGSKKSASSRLPLQGYAHGYYGRQETSTVNLREGASTSYAIEQVLYYLGGMFAHLDDGLKGNNVPQKEVEKFYKMISTIGGHAVTKQGGKRGVWGQGEGGFGIEPYPRSSGVWTVETLPASEGHASDLARYVVVSLDGAHAINTELLSVLQGKDAAECMNRATCSYIQWLLPRMQEILESVPAREDAYREQGVHSRTPTSYAKLETGIAALLQYGVSIGAHTEQEAAALLEESRARLIHVALAQKAMMGVDDSQATENDAVTVFYKLLHKAMGMRKLHITDAAYRAVNVFNSKGEVESIAYRPQPPLFLSNEDIKHGLKSIPDSYGWEHIEHLAGVYKAHGIEAGVLKWDGVKPVLYMYASDFKDHIYPIIDEVRKETPLPGHSIMIAKLKAAGKLTSIKNSQLHGRNSGQGSIYVLDMTPSTEHQEDTTPAPSTEHQAAAVSSGVQFRQLAHQSPTAPGRAPEHQEDTTPAPSIEQEAAAVSSSVQFPPGHTEHQEEGYIDD